MVQLVAKALAGAGKAIPALTRMGGAGAVRTSGPGKGLPESVRIPEGATGYTAKGGAIQWKYPTPTPARSGPSARGGFKQGVGTVVGRTAAEGVVAATGLSVLLNRFSEIAEAVGSLESALEVIASENAQLAARIAKLLEDNENDLERALLALSEQDRDELGHQLNSNRGFTHLLPTADPLRVSQRAEVNNAQSNRSVIGSELVQLEDRARSNSQLQGRGGELPSGASDFLP